jgi:uncharacterized protein (TIGR00730 family)
MTDNKNQRLSAITPHRDAVIKLLDHETEERVGRIDKEFRDGLRIVNGFNYTVTIFGSARFLEDNKYYQKAREVSNALANNGFTIITGGGGGVMEAANRGAFEAGGNSIGFNIKLPNEQQLNAYTTKSMSFHYFFARKFMLTYAASALICFPGGFGTLDEMFEVITLVQTGKIPPVPIILVGSEFWKPLDIFIKEQLLTSVGAISHGDEELYEILDNPSQIVSLVEDYRETTSVFAMPSENPAI